MLGAALLVPAAMASPPTLRSMSWSHLSRQELRGPAARVGPPPRYFTTFQDHFDGKNNRTWQQAYYVNASQFDGTGPVFLCVGGEGPPLDGSVVTASPHCNVAVEMLPATKGIMFAVEHRYYGARAGPNLLPRAPPPCMRAPTQLIRPCLFRPLTGCHNMSACPYSSSDAKPLTWLSSHQALMDLATFHSFATIEYGLTKPGNKWITFGGSYPGMLAGWSRVLYPSLFHASISSSAPVIAKLDMVEYFDITARAYSLTSVGGSAACEANIRKGHVSIKQLFNTSAGRAQLASLFPAVKIHGSDWLSTREGQSEFAGNGVISFPSQSNDPSCTGYACNIAQICKVMTGGEAASPLHRLAKLASHWEKERVEAEAVKLVEEEKRATSPHELLDYWGYQTCTEFGFYQTCEIGSKCFFAQGYNLLPGDDAFCHADYQITPKQIQANIDASNAYYGAGRPDLAHNASRILYVNGDVDPWSGLSILKSPAPALPTLLVPGASHHAWTHPSKAGDQPSVVHARGLIRKQIEAWLAEA